jgi:hypothetical protein
LGRTNDKFVEIRSGLTAGEQIVLNPMAILDESEDRKADQAPDEEDAQPEDSEPAEPPSDVELDQPGEPPPDDPQDEPSPSDRTLGGPGDSERPSTRPRGNGDEPRQRATPKNNSGR